MEGGKKGREKWELIVESFFIFNPIFYTHRMLFMYIYIEGHKFWA